VTTPSSSSVTDTATRDRLAAYVQKAARDGMMLEDDQGHAVADLVLRFLEGRDVPAAAPPSMLLASVEDLDALTGAPVVIDRDGDAWQRRRDRSWHAAVPAEVTCSADELLDAFGPVRLATASGRSPSDGPWVARHHDWSGIGIFAEEIDALRYAIGHGMSLVERVGWGELR
jgi:hypothetical protein